MLCLLSSPLTLSVMPLHFMIDKISKLQDPGSSHDPVDSIDQVRLIDAVC